MLNKILNLSYKALMFPFNFISAYWERLFNFVLPNVRVLLKKRVLFSMYPNCSQKTLITGDGTVEIGENCSFGYKLGGFYRGGSIELQSKFFKSHIKIGTALSCIE